MSKKKRFKKNTVGKIYNFFSKKAYVAYNNVTRLVSNSNILQSIDNSYSNKATHFNKCYKKKSI